MNSQSRFPADVQDVTSNLLLRIASGCASLSILEKTLLDYIDKNKDTIHPGLLLDTCRYFRISVDMETKAVLDFIAKSRSVLPNAKPLVLEELMRQIDELPVDRKNVVISAINLEKD